MESSISKSQEIYHYLWSNIANMRLKPGERLSEAGLARQFHCSRVPVREAVRLLAAEGALTTFPQRGSFVSCIDMRRVERARYLREVLETRVVLDDFDKGLLPPVLPYIKSLIKKQEEFAAYGEYDRLRDSDVEFHSLFYLIDDKEFVLEHTGERDIDYLRARHFAMQIEQTEKKGDAESDIVLQHRGIVEAIERGARAALEKEFIHHLRNLKHTLVESNLYRETYRAYFQ